MDQSVGLSRGPRVAGADAPCERYRSALRRPTRYWPCWIRHVRSVSWRLPEPGPNISVRPSGQRTRLTECPITRYATTPDGVNVTYQVAGDGPLDLVVTTGFAYPIGSQATTSGQG